MKKIDERLDISKQVLKVNLESPVFRPMLDTLDEQIIEVIKQVYSEEFESGDISLKITLSVPLMTKRFPTENKYGEPVVKSYEYKALQFKHNITTTLKKVDKENGSYYGEKELKEDGGKFIEAPIKDPQVSIFDEE